jgi:hypothetical protein
VLQGRRAAAAAAAATATAATAAAATHDLRLCDSLWSGTDWETQSRLEQPENFPLRYYFLATLFHVVS